MSSALTLSPASPFARSARVAHFLPEWLPGVDVCEAVEYVLPLLAGLIDEEPVKEVFAPKLDHVMWHFFAVRRPFTRSVSISVFKGACGS